MQRSTAVVIPPVVRNFFELCIVCMVCGALLLIFGGIIAYNEDRGVDRFTSVPVAYLSIGIGIIVVVFSFVGTYAVFKLQGKQSMLTTLIAILSVFCISQCLLGGFSLSTIENNNYELTIKARKAVSDLFKRYGTNKDDNYLINTFQEDFVCCGVSNASEWYTNGVGYVPYSCCDIMIALTCTSYYAYSENCTKAYLEFITTFVKVVAGISLSFAGIELIGIIFACVIYCRNKKR